MSNLIEPHLRKLRKYDAYWCIVLTEGYFACGEDAHTLRLISKLVDLRVGYAKWIR